jgi:hypothetical protein
VPLARARGGASQEGLISLLGAERMRSHFFVAGAMGPALRTGNRPAEILSRLSRLFFSLRGVQRGYFSFHRKRSEIMKADELLISAEELPWRNPISACRLWLNECTGDLAPTILLGDFALPTAVVES